MQSILQDAVQRRATDIVLINNTIWFRIQGKLQSTNHTAMSFDAVPNGFEKKSDTHIRCLPTDLTLSGLQYPGEVSKVLDFEKGLVILSGAHNSGKTTLILHWLNSLKDRSVESEIALPPHMTPSVLWSTDQPDIRLVKITNATSALQALRDSIHHLVIAVLDARTNADALRHIRMLLSQYNPQTIQSLMSEQVCSLVNIALVRTVHQQYRPLVSITNRNESISAQIAEGDFHKLEDSVQRGNGGLGSLSCDVQLAEWLQQRQIQLDEGLRFANYPATMRLRASGIIHND